MLQLSLTEQNYRTIWLTAESNNTPSPLQTKNAENYKASQTNKSVETTKQ
jgi:hypothetical protein